MKKIFNYITLLSVILVFSVSCDRDVEFDTISVTPPSLCVVTHKIGEKGQRITSATVKIYKINTDKSKSLMYTKTSDDKGYVKLDESEMRQTFPEPTGGASRGGKLFFEASSQDNTMYGELESAYINMTDGETWQWVELDAVN